MTTALSDDLYQRFRDLLLNRCGLFYPERKRPDLAHGLGMALNASSYADLEALYADALNGGPAWDALLTALTVGETYFFRNSSQFDALRQHIVPDLLARRATLRSMRFWSAGCATGEEPYSLAMLLRDLLPDHDTWQLSILATDINPNFLARAREALYGEWSFRETPDALRSRFFRQEQSRWRLCPEIRRMVNFMRLNLAEPCYPSVSNGTCALDIIVCRNVTIYFDEATTRQVVDRFYSALAPGGWLIVGHAEPQASIYHQFEVHNFPYTVVYRKPLDAPLFAFDASRGTFSAGARPILDPRSHAVKSTREQPAVVMAAPAAAVPAPAAAEVFASATDRWPAITARLAHGDKAGAEGLLEELLRVAPEHVEALLALARLCADRGEWLNAQQLCERAIDCDPLRPQAHYILGQIYEHQNEYDAALAAYRRTTYLDRQFVPGMIGMANIWRQKGRAADAQRCYRNALKQLASSPSAAAVAGLEGMTVDELIAFVKRQLQMLG